MVKGSHLFFATSFALICFSISLVSCGSGDIEQSEAKKESMTGEQVYNQNCASCHGKEGDLGISGAANLQISIKTLEQKIDFIKNGSGDGKMAAYGKSKGGVLSKSQIKKVAEYIDGFSE